MDGLANALVGAAAADISAHGVVDFGVGGRGFFGQQRDRGHDLPGWQYPHCGTFVSIQACCTGWLASDESPSMVVIFFPATVETGVTQERAASPSMCTVQAPHRAMPQPNFVPVMLRVSRRHPEQRHLRADIHGLRLAVQDKSDGHKHLRSSIGRRIIAQICSRRCGDRITLLFPEWRSARLRRGAWRWDRSRLPRRERRRPGRAERRAAILSPRA